MKNLLASLKNNESLAPILLNPTFIKYQSYILPVVAILISGLLLFLIVIPQISVYQDINKKVTEFDQKYSVYAQKIKTLEGIKESVYQDNIEDSLKVLPEDRNIPGAIGQVLQIINRSGLSLDGMTFIQNAPAPVGVNGLQIRMDLSGQKSRLLDFFQTTRSSIRIIRVTGLEVVSGTDPTRMQANIILSTYSQPLTMIAGSLDQQVVPVSEKELQVLDAVKQQSGGSVPVSTESAGPIGKSDPFE